MKFGHVRVTSIDERHDKRLFDKLPLIIIAVLQVRQIGHRCQGDHSGLCFWMMSARFKGLDAPHRVQFSRASPTCRICVASR